MDITVTLVWMAFVITAFMVGRTFGYRESLDEIERVFNMVISVKME